MNFNVETGNQSDVFVVLLWMEGLLWDVPSDLCSVYLLGGLAGF